MSRFRCVFPTDFVHIIKMIEIFSNIIQFRADAKEFSFLFEFTSFRCKRCFSTISSICRFTIRYSNINGGIILAMLPFSVASFGSLFIHVSMVNGISCLKLPTENDHVSHFVVDDGLWYIWRFTNLSAGIDCYQSTVFVLLFWERGNVKVRRSWLCRVRTQFAHTSHANTTTRTDGADAYTEIYIHLCIRWHKMHQRTLSKGFVQMIFSFVPTESNSLTRKVHWICIFLDFKHDFFVLFNATQAGRMSQR